MIVNNKTDSTFTMTLFTRFYITIVCNYGGNVTSFSTYKYKHMHFMNFAKENVFNFYKRNI